jgi:flagellin
MTVINTNIKSLVAQNALKGNNRALSAAMEQLSTGKRINSARDDAAGLAISSRMTAQIRGLDQAVRNANDGISLLQTAEGAMVEVTNMLQRMRELSIQAANDTYSSSDRASLDLEYQQLMAEISRIAGNTEWNGMQVLNNTNVDGQRIGTGGLLSNPDAAGTEVRSIKFQVGANADQTIGVAFKDFSFGVGTPPVASEAQLNLSANDLTGAKVFRLVLNNVTFSATLGSAISGSSTSTTEAEALRAALVSAIQSGVGYENVLVTRVGTTLTVQDSEGRPIGSLTADKANGSAVTTTAVKTTVATGSPAVVATQPPSQAIFSGSARLNNTSITSSANANTAIARIDEAINRVNNERAMFGAVVNRLTYAGDNLTNVSMNTSESRSRILDTDYAKASSELSRTQIIAQAATAVLAQANTDQQTVLKLLQ